MNKKELIHNLVKVYGLKVKDIKIDSHCFMTMVEFVTNGLNTLD